nr:hypothetical protein [Frankia sp. AvcI1]
MRRYAQLGRPARLDRPRSVAAGRRGDASVRREVAWPLPTSAGDEAELVALRVGQDEDAAGVVLDHVAEVGGAEGFGRRGGAPSSAD